MNLSEFNLFYNQLVDWGIKSTTADYLNMLILLFLVAIIAYGTGKAARAVIIRLLHRISLKTKNVFDDYLIKHRFPKYIASLLPCVIFNISTPLIFADFQNWIDIVLSLIDIYVAVLVIIIGRSILLATRDYLKTKDEFKDKPVESFIQVIIIFLYIAVGVVIFSLLTGKSPWAFLTAMGAASAVLLLVFKDTILGFVASIQVATNDMVRIGDWITMEKYDADGDVIEITLATVKVQNWDKTITTIPTYYLISDSFKNWRGMQDSGGRRIKRSIYIKICSIHHLTPAEIESMKQIDVISNYLSKQSVDLHNHNLQHSPNNSIPVNGRHLTNIGVFRKYINYYLETHPDIHQDMTVMVRQLSPTVTGIPIEIYAFSKETAWLVYEELMSDIFDHLLASVPYFKLEIFEMPASGDIRNIGMHSVSQESSCL